MQHRSRSVFALMTAAGLMMAADAASNRTKSGGKKAAPASAAPAEFEKKVQPFLTRSCAPCHNERLASGSLNLDGFHTHASLSSDRDGWERILHKIRTGEMPPKGIPRPPQPEIDALMTFVLGEFEKADRLVKPDPGRVTARRLNRNE